MRISQRVSPTIFQLYKNVLKKFIRILVALFLRADSRVFSFVVFISGIITVFKQLCNAFPTILLHLSTIKYLIRFALRSKSLLVYRIENLKLP